MGSHLLGLRDPSQLQELRKSNNMKLPLILAATLAVSPADPHYLRSYGVGPIHRLRSRFGSFGRYGDQAFRSALASQAFRNNLISQSPVSTIGSYNALGGDLSNQGNFPGYANGAQLKTYSNFQNYLSKSPVPFSEPARVDNIISCHTDRQLLWEAAGANCQSPRSQRRLGLHEELLWQG